MKSIIGRVRKHPRGHGFLIPESDGVTERIYLFPEDVSRLLQGDRIRVQLRPGRPGLGPRAEVTEVLGHTQTHCIGTLRKASGHWWVKRSVEDPDPDLFVVKEHIGEMRDGMRVLANITSYGNGKQGPQGEVLSVLEGNDASHDVLRAAVRGGWPVEFSHATEESMDEISFNAELPYWRRDCTQLPLVTIDGEDAKDFDDAVCVIPQANGAMKLYVAIADVSHYVLTDSPVDRDAYQRTTSCYFPGTVIPMLPEKLSNDLCSLVPREDREVMVCEVDYEASGERRKFQLYPGRMNSRKRCTYSEVENFHQTGHIDAPEDVKKSLELLYKLYEILKRDRDKRGALDFELPESRVYVDDEGNPTQIVRETRYDSHKLIEEMMIAANVCAAEFLHKHGKDGMYRVHDVPQEKKLIAFMSLAKGHFPRELPRIHELRQGPKSLQQFLRVVRGSPKEEVFNMLALRSMPMAVYSSQLAPHYGLGLKAYTHFTSPIRRYPDLVVHRLIKRALGFVPQDEKRPPTPKNWNLAGAAEQCSLQERAAMDMERKVVEIKKARFIEPFIGDAFTARVTSPARPGLFVRLDAYPVEGLIPMETLPRDRYVFDEVHQSLEGQNPKHRFHIGDNVQVVLTDVNPDAGRVTFELMYDSLKSR